MIGWPLPSVFDVAPSGLAAAVVVTVLPVSALTATLFAVLPVECASMYACVVSSRVARAIPAPTPTCIALPVVVSLVPAVLALIDTSPAAVNDVVPVRYAWAVVVTSSWEIPPTACTSVAPEVASTVEVAEIVTFPEDVIVALFTATTALEFTETTLTWPDDVGDDVEVAASVMSPPMSVAPLTVIDVVGVALVLSSEATASKSIAAAPVFTVTPLTVMDSALMSNSMPITVTLLLKLTVSSPAPPSRTILVPGVTVNDTDSIVGALTVTVLPL
ncbi:hypothetical protein GCM10023087_34790 [Microbacterium rhizosphaerae]